MRTITFIIAIVAATIYSAAQSVNIHQGNSSVGFNVSDIDSIIFSNNNATDNEYKGNGNVLAVDGHWLSLGTSISWYNSNVSSAFTKGYQTRVMEQIKFSKFTNNGANASCLSSAKDYVINADYYEDVLKATEVSFSAITARKEGKVAENAPRKVKVGKIGLPGGEGASAIAAKHKIENRRSRVFLLDMTSVIMALVTIGFTFIM
ncbi:MAG: putative ABC exporter domain-containing protein, partial [Bacteroidaceae bacterium]